MKDDIIKFLNVVITVCLVLIFITILGGIWIGNTTPTFIKIILTIMWIFFGSFFTKQILQSKR